MASNGLSAVRSRVAGNCERTVRSTATAKAVAELLPLGVNFSRHSVVVLVLLAGCQFTPSPTSKPVTTNDVIGVWSFPEDYGKTTVLMTFMPSGVFTQQVVSATQTNTQVGSWSLDGPHLNLTDFLAEIDGGWKPYSMHWYFIDGDRRPLEIFGGAFPDPDAFQHLSYLRAAP